MNVFSVPMENVLLIIIGILVIAASVVIFWREYVFRIKTHAKEVDTRRKVYELAILKELGGKIGYTLDVEKMVDIITGSLQQFIEYATVSYMLLEPNKIIFKIDLECSVSKNFIKEVRGHMKRSLEALLGRKVLDKEIEERDVGVLTLENAPDEVRSYFNIPLVIDEKVVGLLTVAHSRAGLYKEEDMTILYKIVAQASQAITKLEQVVKTEQAKLSAMVESLTDGVIMTDREYRVIIVNSAAKK